MNSSGSVVGWLTAWLLMFMLLFILARTRAGHTIIYYLAWLMVALLIVSHGKQVASILSGGNFTNG